MNYKATFSPIRSLSFLISIPILLFLSLHPILAEVQSGKPIGSPAPTTQLNSMPSLSFISYTLTVNVNGSGSVIKTPNKALYNPGEAVGLTAVPVTGSQFINWTGSITSSSNPVVVLMSNNLFITANFRQTCYSLTLTHTGTGNDPYSIPTNSAGCAVGTFHYGENISLTADPDPGHQVLNWEGTTNDAATTIQNSLVMPALNHIASANYIAIPTLEFKAANFTVNENSAIAAVTIERTGFLSETVTVDFSTSDGSAETGSDYTAVNKSLTFPVGAVTQTVEITILDDVVSEGIEDISLALSNPSGNAQLGNQQQATLDILDDEGDSTVQFIQSDFDVDEDDGTAEVTITLFPQSAEVVFVDFATTNGSATEGEDFINTPKTIRFDPGDTVKTVDIPIIDDALDEHDETIELSLFNPFNAEISLATAEAIIDDDDPKPTVQFSSVEYYAEEGQETAVITVTLNVPSGRRVKVKYRVNDLPNLAESSKKVIFNPGETLSTIELSIDDNEAGDMIGLSFYSPDDVKLGSPSETTLFIFEENRGDCHPLIRDRIGSGGYPEASPSRSIGCAEGAYVPGDMIELTASPDPGWVIDHWIGTTSNDSKSVSNSFQMPDDDHAVTVVYRTVYYLPIITNNYTHYHSSPNEAEPNDSNNTANGSLISGNVYEGNFPSGNDMDDYYYFYLFNAGTVNISLTNIGAGHNYDLILRDKDGILMGYSGELDHNNEHITLTLPKEGVYFVRVFNRSATGSSQKYWLRVTHE